MFQIDRIYYYPNSKVLKKMFDLHSVLAFCLRMCYDFYAWFGCDKHKQIHADRRRTVSTVFPSGRHFHTFVSAQIEMVPQNYQPLNEEQAVMMQKLIDTMEDDDDVQNVWHNWEE